MCEHKFIHLETHKNREIGIYNHIWRRVDTFYCEKCLEYKDAVRSESARDKPDWY